MKDSNGFTLLELMITIAVLAILVAIATPSFRTTIQRSQVNEQMKNFSTFLQEARGKAVIRRVPHVVNIGAGVVGGRAIETNNTTSTFSADSDHVNLVTNAGTSPNTLTFSLMGTTGVEACYVITHTQNPSIGQVLRMDRNGSMVVHKNQIAC